MAKLGLVTIWLLLVVRVGFVDEARWSLDSKNGCLEEAKEGDGLTDTACMEGK